MQQQEEKEVVLLNGKEEKDVVALPTPSSTYFPLPSFSSKKQKTKHRVPALALYQHYASAAPA